MEIMYTINAKEIFDDTHYFENTMIQLLNSDFLFHLSAAEIFTFNGFCDFWKNYIKYYDTLMGDCDIVEYVNDEAILHSQFIDDMIKKYDIKEINIYDTNI